MIDETADEAAERMERKMSAPKWTPGPWARCPAGGFEAVGSTLRVKHSSSFIESAFCGNDADGESIANDHLIAAAPELYEALERLLANHDNDGSEGAKRDIEIATAALKKARGE